MAHQISSSSSSFASSSPLRASTCFNNPHRQRSLTRPLAVLLRTFGILSWEEKEGAGCTALSRLFIMAGNIFLLAHSINGSPAAVEQCSLAEGNRGCLAVFLLQFSILVWGFVNLGLFVWLCYQ